jgi:Protein of unknown function (DUF2924)
MARSNNTSVDTSAVEAEVARIQSMSKYELIVLWRRTFETHPPLGFTKGLIGRYLANHVQEKAFGSLDRETKNFLDALARGREPKAPRRRRLKPGTVIIREYQGERHEVTVAADGFIWRGNTYASLSMIAREITGTSWNGPRFFGVRMNGRSKGEADIAPPDSTAAASKPKAQPKVRHRRSRISLEGRL